MENKKKSYIYVLHHIVLCIFSLGAVFSKLASKTDFMSKEFFLFYGLQLLIMVVYAIIWQQLIKRMSLMSAYAHRAVTVIWGIIWGAIFFGENITWNKIVGAVIIVLGILFYVNAEYGNVKRGKK